MRGPQQQQQPSWPPQGYGGFTPAQNYPPPPQARPRTAVTSAVRMLESPAGTAFQAGCECTPASAECSGPDPGPGACALQYYQHQHGAPQYQGGPPPQYHGGPPPQYQAPPPGQAYSAAPGWGPPQQQAPPPQQADAPPPQQAPGHTSFNPLAGLWGRR